MSTILLLAIEAFAYDITYSFTYPYGAAATAVTGQVSPLSEEACITPPPGGMKVIVTYEAQ